MFGAVPRNYGQKSSDTYIGVGRHTTTVSRRTVETTLAAVIADAVPSPDGAGTAETIGGESHHPGPPRFIHAGEVIADPAGNEGETRDDLAPWNPDPDGEYAWSIVDGPAGFDRGDGGNRTEIADESILSGDAVVEFDPSIPGTYRLELDAPDGTHSLTVRVYPAEDETATRPQVSLDAGVEDGELRLKATATRSDPVETATPQARSATRARATGIVADPDWAGDTSPDRGKTAAESRNRRPHSSREDRNGRAQSSNEDTELEVEFFVDDRHRPRLAGLDGPIGPADLDGRVRVYAVAVGDRHSVPDAIDLVPDGDSIRVERPFAPPAWIEDAVIYEIFTRRFPDQDDPTFATIAERIPHLADLGVDAVWMTPFLATDRGFGTPASEGGPHGYHTTDYFATDPDLGTIEEFEALVETCHDHGIKVLFDLVINHTADSHPFVTAATDPDHPQHDRYVDWYRWFDRDELDPEYYFGWTGIYNLDYANPAVRAFALEVIEFWAQKVDGIRADVAWGVPLSFWYEVADRIKRENPDFLLLDETIPYDVDCAPAFDLHYDDELHTALGEAATRDPAAVLDAIDRRSRVGAPDDALFLQYVENHDTDRYLAEHARPAHRGAVAATFTLPGVPMLYYGQETGLRHWREPMNWGAFDEELVAFHRRLVALFHDHPALGPRGRFERIEYDTLDTGTIAFARVAPETDERIIVVLNFAAGTAQVTIDEPIGDTDLLTGSAVPIESSGRGTTVTVDSVLVVPVRK